MKAKAFALEPAAQRKDFYCNECRKVTSVYVRRKEKSPAKVNCAWCADSYFIEKYSSAKHGYVTGLYGVWSSKDLERLKGLLQLPLTWDEIAEEFVGRRSETVRKTALRYGFKKKYQMRVKGEIRYVTDETV